MNRAFLSAIGAVAVTVCAAGHQQTVRKEAGIPAAGPRGLFGRDVPLSDAENRQFANRITVEGQTAEAVQAVCERAAKDRGVLFQHPHKGVHEGFYMDPQSYRLTIAITRDKSYRITKVDRKDLNYPTSGDKSSGKKVTFTIVTLKGALVRSDVGRVAVADINKDGHPDIIAGGNWYEGPAWKPHAFYQVTPPPKGYIDGPFGNAFDVDGDGYLDILCYTVPDRHKPEEELFWLKNPGPPYTGLWKKYMIATDMKYLEVIRFADIDGDNMVEMITVDDGGGRQGGIRIYEIPVDPMQPPTSGWPWRWVKNRTIHGLAIGDLNQDGRLDIAGDFRWYEQTNRGDWVEYGMPAPPIDDHNDRNKRGHLTMQSLIYDVDGDGDPDVIWARAHNYGAFWMESSGGSKPTFTLHEILPRQLPSTIHGPAYGDIDGDGDVDIFAGKCRYTHYDPGQKDPLDVFWIELVRSGGRVSWVKHPLATHLNMGFSPAVADIDQDGDRDLVMGTMGHARGIPPQAEVIIFRNDSSR